MKTFIHETAIVERGAKIGSGTKIWHHAHIREGATVGDNCTVGKNAYIDVNVKIGSGVKIQNNVCVYDSVIEDDAELGPGVVITNDLYPRAFIWDEKRRGRKTIIKKGASVGANSTIICGHTIGMYAMVGAGSVVTKDVPAHALVYGNPARIRGFVCTCGKKLDESRAKIMKDFYVMECEECKKKVNIEKEIFERFISQPS